MRLSLADSWSQEEAPAKAAVPVVAEADYAQYWSAHTDLDEVRQQTVSREAL